MRLGITKILELLCIFVIVGQDFALFSGNLDWHGLLVSYRGVPIFLVLWFGYKWRHKTKIVPLRECNFAITQDD